jgi:hypothetical protein
MPKVPGKTSSRLGVFRVMALIDVATRKPKPQAKPYKLEDGGGLL